MSENDEYYRRVAERVAERRRSPVTLPRLPIDDDVDIVLERLQQRERDATAARGEDTARAQSPRPARASPRVQRNRVTADPPKPRGRRPPEQTEPKAGARAWRRPGNDLRANAHRDHVLRAWFVAVLYLYAPLTASAAAYVVFGFVALVIGDSTSALDLVSQLLGMLVAAAWGLAVAFVGAALLPFVLNLSFFLTARAEAKRTGAPVQGKGCLLVLLLLAGAFVFGHVAFALMFVPR